MSISGFFLINKPIGITSHDVVHRLRKIVSEKTIGHAGTLDPRAEGLLIVAISRTFTKQIERFKKLDKTYLAEVTLGTNSNTDDSEGELISISSDKPSTIEIKNALSRIQNEIEQMPPQFSAKKIKGQTAYRLARSGHIVDLKPVPVKIYNLNLLDYNYPVVQFRCQVSAGTYIRSIARDLGKTLGVGGYLSNLVREKIGRYNLENAINIDDVKDVNDLSQYKVTLEGNS